MLIFCASGTTQQVAKQLCSVLNADLYEIQPKLNYSDADLGWNDAHSRSSIEMKDESNRPELVEPLPASLRNHSILFIGFPIWWDVEPRIVDTFLDTLNPVDWTIYVFATSGGSRVNGSLRHLKKTYPAFSFKQAKLVDHHNVIQWAESLFL